MMSDRAGSHAPATDAQRPPANTTPGLAFGPFVLYPQQHLLLREGEPVTLGSRAMGLLIALASRPGELLEKRELLGLAWPKAVVEECNLRAQVVALRRTLGPGSDYVMTVPGRGYRFVAPLAAVSPVPSAAQVPSPLTPRAPGLPPPLLPMIGRDRALAELSEQVLRHRCVTLTGPGGVGKTTLAAATAHRLRARFARGTPRVDLATASTASEVHALLAHALESSALDTESSAHLRLAQKGGALLLVDHCEHLLAAVAEAVETLLQHTPGLHLLICSREPLQARGEYVQALAPLPTPPLGRPVCAEPASAYPAVALFLERVAAQAPDFVFHEQDAQAVGAICRTLDGNPLALEIAAARVRSFGVQGLLALLDTPFRLQMTGRRTAAPRHRTLNATLDWAYALLDEREQAMLRHLGVFTGSFSLEAVQGVLNPPPAQAHHLPAVLESLVAKSLLCTVEQGRGPHYRLSETTRFYAREKLVQYNEYAGLSRQHAVYVRARLTDAVAALDRLAPAQWLGTYSDDIDHLRTALHWAFSPAGNTAAGIQLTLLGSPLWLRLSLLGECRAWIEKGLHPDSPQHQTSPHPPGLCGLRRALRTLSASLLTLSQGAGTAVRRGWQAVLDDAEQAQDSVHQLRALWGLWTERLCSNAPREGLAIAQCYRVLSQRSQTPGSELIGQRMVAVSHFYQGELAAAREAISAALAAPVAPASHLIDVHFDQRLAVRALQAQVQLLEGHEAAALLTLERCLEDTTGLNHPTTLWYCLCYSALPIALLINDLPRAEHYLAALERSACPQSLPWWWHYTQAFACAVRLRRAPCERTVARLGELLGTLREQNGTPLYSLFSVEYARAQGALGLPRWGLDALEQTLSRPGTQQAPWLLPELLRVKALLLRTLQGSTRHKAWIASLREAQAIASAQGAVFWTSRIEGELQAPLHLLPGQPRRLIAQAARTDSARLQPMAR
jgi:predicted ATPase/DNA-binding winged helix-turn-helix (wHTH) protein